MTFDTFENKVSFEQNENNLDIKFNADEISLETVVNYVFHNLKAIDMKIKELSLEDVVKTILENNSK
jgi:ABC-type uncharacterized transport system ATPase subunit